LRARTDILGAAAVFAVLTAIFFAPSLLEGKTLSAVAGHQGIQWPWGATPTGFPDSAQSDDANSVYPIGVDYARYLHEGTFPFWSPESFAGGPTLGTVFGTGFYPFRVVGARLLSPAGYHDLLLIVHTWLAGFALFLLARRLRASWLAAVLAGIAWMFAPSWFALAALESTPVLAALLPLALWLVHRAVGRRSLSDGAACGVVLALLVLGASVQPAVFAFLIVGVWGLALAGRDRAALAPVVVAGVLGVALSAVVLLPVAAQVSGGRAAIPYGELTADDVGLDDLVRIFDRGVPGPLGVTIFRLAFIGLPVALLGLGGLLTRRRPGAGLARALVLVFGLAVIGTPVTWLAYHLVPGVAYLRPIGRLLPFFTLGLVLAAALGLDALRDRVARWGPERHRPRALTAFTVLAVALCAVEAWQVGGFSRDVSPPFHPRTAALLYPPTPLTGALGALGAQQEAAGQVQRMVALHRGAPGGPFAYLPFEGETPRIFRVQNIGGYLNVVPTRTRMLVRYLAGADAKASLAPPVDAYLANFWAADTRYAMLPRLGVSTIVAVPDVASDPATARGLAAAHARVRYAGPDGTVAVLPGRTPRAFVVDGVQTARGEADAFARFTDPAFDPHRAVLLDGADAAGVRSRPGTRVAARVRVLPTGPNDRTVDVDSPRAGWLVLLESAAPGWRAQVGGHPAALHRADFAFRAVRVPAGHSRVTMHYRAPRLVLGLVISLLAALAALGIWGRAARRSRRRA
jgi:hypothetical protein